MPKIVIDISDDEKNELGHSAVDKMCSIPKYVRYVLFEKDRKVSHITNTLEIKHEVPPVVKARKEVQKVLESKQKDKPKWSVCEVCGLHRECLVSSAGWTCKECFDKQAKET